MPKNLWKKGFRKFIIKENGAVSIYAIILILFIFAFNAVLIDYVRIMVAEHQTDTAVKEGMRSSFSGYDKYLQNSGLFVMSDEGETPNQIFDKVFEKNLIVDADDDDFKFVETKPEKASLTSNEDRTFSNKEIVKHQIKEDMKYKAPIAYGEKVLDAFLPAACSIEEAEVVADAAEDVEENVKKRDDKIDSAKTHIQNAKDKLDGIKDLATHNATNDDKYPDITYIRDIQHYKSEYEKDDDSSSKSKFEQNSKDKLSKIKTTANAAYKQIKKAKKDIDTAKKKNKKIGKAIKKAEDKAEDNYEGISDDKCEGTSSEESGAEDVKKELKELWIDPDEDDFFSTMDSHLRHSKDRIRKKSNSLYKYVSTQKRNLDDFLVVVAKVSKIEKRFNEAKNCVDSTRDYITGNYDETSKQDMGTDDDGYEDQAENKLGSIKDLINGGESIQKDVAAYQALESLENQYGNAHPDDGGDLDMDDPEEGRDDSFNIIRDIFEALSDFGLKVRDKAYISEYILTRFKSSENMGLTQLPDTFLLRNRQVEYILYGQHAAGMNYTMALTELTAVRFVLNFAAAFAEPRIKMIPTPLGKVAWALKRSLELTLQDMYKLTENGENAQVPVTHVKGSYDYYPTYNDYLRLFLLVHPDGDDNRITRIQALLDYWKDTDEDGAYWSQSGTKAELIDAPIYATGNAESSVKLWFLPGIMDWFSKTNILDGKVKDNGRYYIDKEVDYSY